MTDEATINAVENALQKHAEKTDHEIQGLAARFQAIRKNALTTVKGFAPSAPRSPGSIIVAHERVQALRDGVKHSGRVSLGELNCKGPDELARLY